MEYELAADEQELIERYRRMNAVGRNLVLECAGAAVHAHRGPESMRVWWDDYDAQGRRQSNGERIPKI